MALLDLFRYSTRERSMAETISTWFIAAGYPGGDAKRLSSELLAKSMIRDFIRRGEI
jgi:hypothetical protein